MRWAVSRFNEAGLFFGHGTDNAWDEALQLILPSLHLPPFLDADLRQARLTRSERQLLAELVQRRVHERVPAAYLTNKARITSYNVCYTKLLRPFNLANSILDSIALIVLDDE